MGLSDSCGKKRGCRWPTVSRRQR